VLYGQGTYDRLCSNCHGDNAVSVKSIPDLRYSATLRRASDWTAIVIGGARAPKGMPSFKEMLAEDEAENIRHYIVSEANKARAAKAWRSVADGHAARSGSAST